MLWKEGFCVWICWGCVGVCNVMLGMWDCDLLHVLARFGSVVLVCVVYVWMYAVIVCVVFIVLCCC